MADEADITSQPGNSHLRVVRSTPTPTSDSPGDSIPSRNPVQPSPFLQDNHAPQPTTAQPSTSHAKDDPTKINQPGDGTDTTEAKTIATSSTTEETVPKSADNPVARMGIAVDNPDLTHSKMRSVDTISQAVPISTSIHTVAPPTHFNGSMADGGGHVSQEDNENRVSVPNVPPSESAGNYQSHHRDQDTSGESPSTDSHVCEDSPPLQHTASATSQARFSPALEAHEKQTRVEKYVPARKGSQRSSNQRGQNSVLSTKNLKHKRLLDSASSSTMTGGASNSNQSGPSYESTPPSSSQRKRRKKSNESGRSSNTRQVPNGLLLESAGNNQRRHHDQDTSAQSPSTSPQRDEDSPPLGAGARSQHTAPATSPACFAPASEKFVPARKGSQRSGLQHGSISVVSTKNLNGKRSLDIASSSTTTGGASNCNQPGLNYKSTPPSSPQKKRRKKSNESGRSRNTGEEIGQLAPESSDRELHGSNTLTSHTETIVEMKHATQDMAEPVPQILPRQPSDAISEERVDYNGGYNGGPNRLSVQSVSSRVLANHGQGTSELHCEAQPSTVISDAIQRVESSNTYIWPLQQLDNVPFVLNVTIDQMQGQHELAQEFDLHDTHEEVRMHFINYYTLPAPPPRQNQHEDAPRELGEHEVRPYSAMLKKAS